MKEEYKKIAENTEALFKLRDDISEKEAKTIYHTGISVRENGFLDSMNEVKELMQKISENDITKVSTLDELFENFETEFNKHNEVVVRMKTEFQLLLAEKKVLVNKIMDNTPNNPNINFLLLNNFSRSSKAIEAFQNLAEEHPDQVRFESKQILNNDLSQNNVRILIEGDLDTIKNLIRSSKNPKVKYLKTIANDKIADNFVKAAAFNNVFDHSRLLDLNSFDSADYNAAYKLNNKANKLK